MKKGIIELEGMEFHAFHGCFESERCNGNHFEVDFRGEYDINAAADSDDLGDTLNYGEVYDVIALEMGLPSDLLENVCGRIVNAIHAQWPGLERFSVRVSKQNPPVNGPCRWSRVTLHYNADEQVL